MIKYMVDISLIIEGADMLINLEDVTYGFIVGNGQGGCKLIRFEDTTYELLVNYEFTNKQLVKLIAYKLRKEINKTYYNIDALRRPERYLKPRDIPKVEIPAQLKKDEEYMVALEKVERIFIKRIQDTSEYIPRNKNDKR